MHVAADLGRIDAQAPRELLTAEPGRFAYKLDGAPRNRVLGSRRWRGTDAPEEIAQRSLDERAIADLRQRTEQLHRLAALGERKLGVTANATETRLDGSLPQLGREREHVELEILARLEQLVILAREKNARLAGAQHSRLSTHAQRGNAGGDEIDLRLGVKMARAPKRGLMSPNLSATPGLHREWLEQRFASRRHDSA